MDEKTERLRDIFLTVADEETVTETQSAARGTLADDDPDDDALTEVVVAMRERYDFATDLDDGALCAVARGFYAGRADTDVADELGLDAATVRRARLDLHLVADRDLDAPFDLDKFRRLRRTGASADELAESFEVSGATAQRYANALDAQAERRLVGDRYREEFDRLLGDGELSEQLTASIKETGLREAAEDIETNVSF